DFFTDIRLVLLLCCGMTIQPQNHYNYDLPCKEMKVTDPLSQIQMAPENLYRILINTDNNDLPGKKSATRVPQSSVGPTGPAGVTQFSVKMWGAGGGGSPAGLNPPPPNPQDYCAGAGGGGSGYLEATVLVSTTPYVITVGTTSSSDSILTNGVDATLTAFGG